MDIDKPFHEIFQELLLQQTTINPYIFENSKKYEIIEKGYTVISNLIEIEIIDKASQSIDDILCNSGKLKLEMDSEKSPSYYPCKHPDLLALFYSTPLFFAVQSLLHNVNLSTKQEVTKYFKHPNSHDVPFARAYGCQIAYRFPDSPTAVPFDKKELEELYKDKWHLDGDDNNHHFSLLVGVALSDQLSDFGGNFRVVPGSHKFTAEFLKRRYKSFENQQQLNKIERKAAKKQGKKQLLNIVNGIDKAEFLKLRKGDVVFAVHKLIHSGGINFTENVRKMVFFRAKHWDFDNIIDETFNDIWADFDGLKDIL